MIKRSFKLIAVVLSFVFAISICGVFATWTFADKSPDEAVSDNITIPGSGADNFDVKVNEIVAALVEELNDEGQVYTNLESRFDGNWLGLYKHSFYGSMDNTYKTLSSTISTLLNDTANNTKWSFIFRAVPDTANNESYSDDTYTTMELYLTDVELGSAGAPTIPTGENIYRVYKTTLTRTNNTSAWVAGATYLGYAPSAFYLEQSLNSTNNQVPSIDFVKWTQGDLGYSVDTAVFTFNNDTPTAYNDLYDMNSDLEKKRYNSIYTDNVANGAADVESYFYYVLETTGTTYYYSYNSSGGYFNYSDTRANGYTGVSYGYNDAEVNYNIKYDSTVQSIRVFTVSNNVQTDVPLTQVSSTSDSTTVQFYAESTGTRYYIEISTSGQTANLTIAKA